MIYTKETEMRKTELSFIDIYIFDVDTLSYRPPRPVVTSGSLKRNSQF